MDLIEEFIYKFIDLTEQDAVIVNDKRFIGYRTKIKHIKEKINDCLLDYDERDTVINLIDDLSEMYLDMSTHFRYLDFKSAFFAGLVAGLKTTELDSEEILKNTQKILEEELNERHRKHTQDHL